MVSPGVWCTHTSHSYDIPPQCPGSGGEMGYGLVCPAHPAGPGEWGPSSTSALAKPL